MRRKPGDQMSALRRLKSVLVLAAAAFGVAAMPAFADIYSFKDEKGVVHFTNMSGLDKRYKLVRKEPPGNSGAPLTDSLVPARVFMPAQEDIQKYSAIIDTAAKAYGVEASLVHAVISAESGYNPYALSRTGAMGLMQLMPETARRYGVQNMMDPVENIHGGVRYLRDLLSMLQGFDCPIEVAMLQVELADAPLDFLARLQRGGHGLDPYRVLGKTVLPRARFWLVRAGSPEGAISACGVGLYRMKCAQARG